MRGCLTVGGVSDGGLSAAVGTGRHSEIGVRDASKRANRTAAGQLRLLTSLDTANGRKAARRQAVLFDFLVTLLA
jgi:hypothetical protein